MNAARRLSPITRPEDVTTPVVSEAPPRESGVFVQGARNSKAPTSGPTPTAESIASILMRRLSLPMVAVVLHACCGQQLRAAVRTSLSQSEPASFPFALRLSAWAGMVDRDAPAEAPAQLAPLVAGRRYHVLEICTPGWVVGYVVVPESVSETTLRAMRDELFDLALRLEEADRRALLSGGEWV
jgi:hypothetical protein